MVCLIHLVPVCVIMYVSFCRLVVYNLVEERRGKTISVTLLINVGGNYIHCVFFYLAIIEFALIDQGIENRI